MERNNRDGDEKSIGVKDVNLSGWSLKTFEFYSYIGGIANNAKSHKFEKLVKQIVA